MSGRTVSVVLWIAAVLLTVALALFQRLTGPSYPVRGSVELDGTQVDLKLRRSHGGAGGLPVKLQLPAGAEGWEASVMWRRYPTADAWRSLPMQPDPDGVLRAEIPHQPPAGKVEYRLELHDETGRRVAFPPGEAAVARFRGEVAAAVLIPHILAMFFSMLFATRSLLELCRREHARTNRTVLVTMALLMVGGLLLGPMVQEAAFGAYWTGWPLGTDLTDNKTLVAFLAWLPATILALRRRRQRWAIVLGWVVMMGVFLIPHSMRGSELDWSQMPAAPPSRGDILKQ